MNTTSCASLSLPAWKRPTIARAMVSSVAWPFRLQIDELFQCCLALVNVMGPFFAVEVGSQITGLPNPFLL
jgi:hypothetical protein